MNMCPVRSEFLVKTRFRIPNILLAACFSVCCFASQFAYALEQKVIQAKDLYFWTETFGKRTDPAMILIMGSGAQGLLWRQEFCEQLAQKGYFVIRYDNRDTGLSSTIDYAKSPYTLKDMADDVALILDDYGIAKANIVGLSMGGVIAMLLDAYHPSRTSSLTLISTSADMRSVFDALEGKPTQSKLSKPTELLLKSAEKIVGNPPKTIDDRIGVLLENLKINTRGIGSIDEKVWRQLALQTIIRQKNPESSGNHFLAIKKSYDLHQQALGQIKAPTKIIHGELDPVFQLDHAQALHKAIPHSELVIIPNLGHGIYDEEFFVPVITEIVDLTSRKALQITYRNSINFPR